MIRVALVLGAILSTEADLACAASASAPKLDGAKLGVVWGLPFAAILLSIAIMPLAAPHFWHRHFGKISVACALAFLLPAAALHGVETAVYELVHVALLEYVPFIVLLLALYTIAGGVRITGDFVGTPAVNTAFLALGTVIASWTGTTGACMLLIQPVIRANLWRRRKTHVFVFFIFLVGNIGGALTPLGDPPLFIGFLEGVDFFWTLRWMFMPMVVVATPLLVVFYLLDRHLHRREGPAPAARGEAFGIDGRINLVLLAGVIGAVLLSGAWQSGVSFTIFHTSVSLEALARTIILLILTLLSVRLTSVETRRRNDFDWFPIIEVAKLFVGIFVAIVPVLAIVRAGNAGVAVELVSMLNHVGGRPDDPMYFWISGLLSAFLDNAPTYLLFYNFAGGDEVQLMGPMARTLLAISAGSVFFGAMTYIGNAPNFMVKSVCESRGIVMPSFFAYIGWSCIFLLPLFVVVTLIFFM